VIADHRSATSPERRIDPVVEGNARLTGYTAVVLVVLLAVEGVTVLSIRRLLVAHALIGFLLIPPIVLKLASVGYRFVRYYAGDRRYREAGPPELLLRLLGPVVVLLTVGVFATGVELWLFGYRFGYQWQTWHKLSFLLWFFAMTVHVLAYLRRTPELALADRDHLRGALTRRSLVVGSVLLGVVLALTMAAYATPFQVVRDLG
jgi:hypothetical protein